MKISKELKVGMLALVALIALILGFKFLKGKDVLNRSPKIYAIFKSVGGLEKSNFVKLKGLTVGTVYQIEPADENVNDIKVTLSLTQPVNIPNNSVAYISSSLLGASNIVIEKGNSTKFLKSGDRIPTRVEEGLLTDLSSEAKPLMGKVRNVADSLNLLLTNVNNTLDDATKRNLQHTIANLNQSTAALNALLASIQGPLAGTLSNLNAVSENLKNQNSQIEGVLHNANSFSEDLAGLKLQRTVDSLNLTLSELRQVVHKMSSPNGSLGALMNDRHLYKKMNDVMLSAEILMDDIRVHPKRYVNISVFGKKNKSGELTAPAKKDTTAK